MQAEPLLAAPRVRLESGFVCRLEGLVRRLSARRERGELNGRAGAVGGGDEFVGHRPYRPGEDVRHLDWPLYARLAQPFVRVHRREAGERWIVLLDTSGSMGLGAPGKLQLAAEVALGLAALGQRFGAACELLTLRPDGALLQRVFARRQHLSDWITALESLEASDGAARGLAALLACAGTGRRRAARLFLLGDLLDLEPAALLALQRPGRRIELARILAPHELSPGTLGLEAVRWIDRERGERLEAELDGALLARYSSALEEREESWRRACARHGLGWSTWSSASPFEDVVAALIGV